MIPFETLLLFSVASLGLAVSPGPDNIFVLLQSALHGPRAGIIVTLGLCSGLVIHTLAVALGVAAIFQNSPVAFTVLKCVGIAFLLYLAVQAFRARPSQINRRDGERPSSGRLYLKGVTMSSTNPKVAIFFLAFLPQFADPNWGSLTIQLLSFGATFIFVAMLVFVAISIGSGILSERLRRSERTQLILNRITGIVLLGIAFHVAIG